MTIHASKGLESPVVILADCDNQGGHNNAYTALVDWPADRRRPSRFQLVTSRENTDELTRTVLAQKEHEQQREELNLLYVALTRARQHLLVTGSASRSKSGWYEYFETAMKSLGIAASKGVYRYATGAYTGANGFQQEKTKPLPEIEVDTRLSRPVVDHAAPEYMIAPSLSYDTSDETLPGARDADGIKRGMAIHRALDLMSRVPPFTAEQTRQQISQEFALTDVDDLDVWMDETCSILNNDQFEDLFKASAYHKALNELPVMYRQNNRPVYGLIDRLVFNDENILLIDYKTHQIKDDMQLEVLRDSFRHQMKLYRTGVEKLWPGVQIKSGLLFTHSARLVWMDQ
jgi:ATP-dependent helicase/nuclease subunit A